MNNKNLYVDIHILQTVPPSNVNRDDTGSPKTAVYGGVTRARVSSQAWKRAVRITFQDMFLPEQLGWRTKHIVDRMMEKIHALDENAASDKLAVKALENAGLKIKSEKDGTGALFFLSGGQAEALAKLIVQGEKDKQKYKDALKANPSVDIALFGRMVADDASLNYDAAVQVAHSISTHAVQTEYDYFTAVDDCSPEDNAGAGHLGTVEFNSSTLYRYATVNVHELQSSLKEDVSSVVRGFAEAFIRSMPTGKQNTFANRTLPCFAYIPVRTDQPVNMVGAFEDPVKALYGGGYEKESCKKLVDYANSCYSTFVRKPDYAYVISAARMSDNINTCEKTPADLLNAETASLEDLLCHLENDVQKLLEE